MKLSEFRSELEKLGFKVEIKYNQFSVSVSSGQEDRIAFIGKNVARRLDFWPNARFSASVEGKVFKLCYLFANTTISARAYEEDSKWT